MSDKIDTYSFLPWVREGIATKIGDTSGSVDKLRASFRLKVNVNSTDPVSAIERTISLYGPGDIIGIDSKAIIKTEPHNWITNFEPNYLPCIDFYDEDFPWRYSPTNPNTKGRLIPWLALVVLEETMFDDGKDMTGKPLPYIILKDTIQPKDVFQPCDQLWAWAHVHVNRDLLDGTVDSGADKVFADEETEIASIIDKYKATLQENPDLAYSRIMCPIKLKENTAYNAFLIPSFESGRLAGLGKDVDGIFNGPGSTFMPTTMAWANVNEQGEDPRKNNDPKQFPVYHRWYFRTGNVGDFEYLVRLLEPKLIDSRVGVRNMDVTNPGSNIDGISDSETKPDGTKYPPLEGVLHLGGALKIPEIAILNPDEYKKYENWDQPYPRKFQKQLTAFINLADDYSKNSIRVSHSNTYLPDSIKHSVPTDPNKPDPDPLITSPLYGRWHALVQNLKTTNDESGSNWIHKLNLDPRHRVTAGFGTKIIQKNQENYMEAAWKQVGDVIEANRRIRQAQMASFVSKQWYTKNIKTLKETNAGAFMNFTQPMHTHIVSKGQTTEKKEEVLTISHQVNISKVPKIVLSPDMRKFSRPGGRIVRYLNFDKSNPVENLANRINKDEVLPSPPKNVPGQVATVDNFSSSLHPSKVPAFFLKWIKKFKWLKYLILVLAVLIIALIAILIGPNLHSNTLGFGSFSGLFLLSILLILLDYRIIRWEKMLKYADLIKEDNQTPEAVDKLPAKPDFTLSIAGENVGFAKGTADSDESKRFKQALKDVSELIQGQVEASKEFYQPELNLDTISKTIFDTINPDKSIPNYIFKTKVLLPDRLIRERRSEVFKEAMAYPEIDSPMYKPLIDISADLFLPNINYVSQNSISLLETNQPFIEAYMVGLNHEFARELLWREYPTDQRGSYFRQFWDVSDFHYDDDDLIAIQTKVRSNIYNKDKLKLAEEEVQKKYPVLKPIDKNDKIIEEILHQNYPNIIGEEFISKLKDELNSFIIKLNEEIRERLKDIIKIHLWSKSSKLGEHDNRELYKKSKIQQTNSNTNNGNQNELVLVIRGELLKKYPNAVIYAHKAQWQPKSDTDNTPDKNKERILIDIDTNTENPPRSLVKTPLYEAKVDPDIYFFGFDLTAETARGLIDGEPTGLDDRAGWFFVIKERPGEPRFGLDVGYSNTLEVWNDFSWDIVSTDVDANGKPKFIDGKYLQITDASFDLKDDTLELNDTEKKIQREEDVQLTWNSNMNSAEIAYILYQAPVMMAVHAIEMLKDKK